MKKGVITVYYDERIVDKVSKLMYKMHLYKTDGYYPICDDRTKGEVGAIVCVYGNGLIVRFLEWLTDYRGKDATKVTIDY